jgi:hypothetical protein
MIYTTNSIENLNRQIRKITKTKVTFDKVVDLTFKDFEANNWQKLPAHAFASWPKKTVNMTFSYYAAKAYASQANKGVSVTT